MRTGLPDNSKTYLLAAGAVVVLLIAVILVATGGTGNKVSEREQAGKNKSEDHNYSFGQERRKPTPQEVEDLKRAGDKVKEARNLFEGIMVETTHGKWDLRGGYENNQEEAKKGLLRAKQLCQEVAPLIDRISNECGSEYLPDECDYPKMLKRINTGIAALNN